MKWDDLCARIGMPTNVSVHTSPPDAFVMTCYYIENAIPDWGGESIYESDSESVCTEDERLLDEDYDY
jgi:hypothetical protein